MTEVPKSEPLTYVELLEAQASSPWLFAFDHERFNDIVERRQQEPGNCKEGRQRAQGMLKQQCYQRSKRLSDFGHPVPAAQLVDPHYIGDIPPWGSLPSLDLLKFVALVVLDYSNQPALSESERSLVMS